MPSDAALTRASFLRLSPVRRPARLLRLPDRRWTDAEWARIQRGLAGRRRDDKWHVFTEGDVAFIHRSWTGNGIYEVTFAPVPEDDPEGGRRIVSVLVETDPERYRSRGEEFECLMVELVLGSVLLGDPAPKLWARYEKLLTRPPAGSTPPVSPQNGDDES